MTSKVPKMPQHSIHELSQALRDIVFDPLTEHLFLNGLKDRYQIAACLDTIEDTQLAIDEYRLLDIPPEWANKGRLYLVIYGVLQATFLQQDALRHLAKALQSTFQTDEIPRLKEIRDLRNMIAGHPTSYHRNKEDAFYAISRISLSLQSFEILEYIDQKSKNMIFIGIKEILIDNEDIIGQTLRSLQRKLKDDIDEHRDHDEPEN